MFCRVGVLVEYHYQSVARSHGHLHAVFQPLIVLVADGELVNDYLYVVVFVPVHLHPLCYLAYLPVYACVEIPFSSHLFEEFAVVSLSVFHYRCENEHPVSGISLVDHFHHFLFCIFHHLLTGLVAVCLSCPCEEEA